MSRRFSTGGAWLFLLFAASALCGACRSQGKYTTQAREEAQENLAFLHAAIEFDLATQQFYSGDLDRALATVRGSLQKNGRVGKSHLLHARVLLEMGQEEGALAALEAGLAVVSANPEFHYYRGIVHEQLGDPASALEEFSLAMELDGTVAQYHIAAAEALVDLGRVNEGRALLDAETGEFRSHPGFRQATGHIALLQDDLEAALLAFSEAAILSRGDPVILEDLCRAQAASGAFAKAERTLARLMATEGYERRADLQRLHASCLLQLERPVEARQILLELTKSGACGHDFEGWVGIVDVALMLGDDRLLRTAADRLLAAASGRHEGYLALAVWQRRTGELQAALASAQEAAARAGDNPFPGRLEKLIRRQLDGVRE